MTYIKQSFLVCLLMLSVLSAYANGDIKSCRGLYSDQKISVVLNIHNTNKTDGSEDLYQAVQAGYNHGFHSSIFLRPFLKHKIGKMIDKFRSKINNVLEENSAASDFDKQNAEAIRRFKNIKMHISETQDEVSRTSLGLLSWLKPWLSFLSLSSQDQNKSLSELGDSYLGLQTLLLLNLRSEKLAQTVLELENYDAFLLRDIQVLEARQMVLRMDFIKDPSVQLVIREQAASADQKIAKLILQVKALRVILSMAQSVMKNELRVSSHFRALYLSNTTMSNSDSYLQAKDLFEMYLREANNLKRQMQALPEPEQKILQKIIRTLER